MKSNFHAAMYLPSLNGTMPGLLVRQDYSVVGYEKNVDGKSEDDDLFGLMRLMMMEVERTLYYGLFLLSDDHYYHHRWIAHHVPKSL